MCDSITATDKLKLLIVDDIPLNLKLLRAQLEAEGHAVVGAANGREALEVLAREPFDGVISDVLMPEIDGFRLCMEVRDDERFRALPFILYTSTYTMASDHELGRGFGADAYLAKPAPVGSIIDALRQAQRAVRPDIAPDVDGRVLRLYSAALTRKLDEKKQLVQRESMQHAITRMLGEANAMGDVMPEVIRLLCESMGLTCGAYWSWDERQRTLTCTETWAGASRTGADWAAACRQRPMAPVAIGLTDGAWWRQAPIWIAAGARCVVDVPVSTDGPPVSTFLLPIRLESGPAGVLQLFSAEASEPDVAVMDAAEAVASQISQFLARIDARETIRRLAHFDFLTGLPNRYLFDEFAARAVAKAHRSGTPLAMLFIDLDGFKQVNDLHGHDAGDHVLTTFALRLRECLRQSDAIARRGDESSAARVGGDEFVVLVEDFEHRSALETVARKILAAAALPFNLAGPTGHIGASVGIAVYPDDGADIDSLRHAADSAMYAAKQAGKNAYRFATPVGDGAPVQGAPAARRDTSLAA